MSAMQRTNEEAGAYTSWRRMRERCCRPSDISYQNYGARGITVCDEWNRSFAAFLRDMGPRPNGSSIERIDGDKGYEPGNTRWATRVEQARNTRSNTFVAINGVEKCISEWIEVLGLSPATVWARINRGFDAAEALKPGRANRGLNIGAGKLTQEKANEIRRLVADGAERRAVAERFGVDVSSISNIIRGKSWV